MKFPCWAMCVTCRALLFGDVNYESRETEDMRVRVRVEVSRRGKCMTTSSCDLPIAYISSLNDLAD